MLSQVLRMEASVTQASTARRTFLRCLSTAPPEESLMDKVKNTVKKAVGQGDATYNDAEQSAKDTLESELKDGETSPTQGGMQADNLESTNTGHESWRYQNADKDAKT
ncbi:hypothetical protein ACKKBG_A37545 [Auxenochlorella protothecoides x Auxenochlorella symbiontica]